MWLPLPSIEMKKAKAKPTIYTPEEFTLNYYNYALAYSMRRIAKKGLTIALPELNNIIEDVLWSIGNNKGLNNEYESNDQLNVAAIHMKIRSRLRIRLV